MKHIPLRHLAGRSLLVSQLALLVAFTACSDKTEFNYTEGQEQQNGENQISVTDENGNSSSLAAGTTVGVYVVGDDGTVSIVTVEVDADGNATLPSTASGSRVVVYSPYQPSWGSEAFSSPQLFAVEADQSTKEAYNASDLMIGVKDEATGSLAMSHKLSKVAIHIVDETGRVDLKRINAELLNVSNSVMVSLATQSVTTLPDATSDVVMLSEMTTDWRISCYAIVAPQTVSTDRDLFAVNLYGNRQTYSAPQSATLEGGKTYTISMRLTEYGLLADGWQIADWSSEAEENIDVMLK